jgi:hypothetical protein
VPQSFRCGLRLADLHVVSANDKNSSGRFDIATEDGHRALRLPSLPACKSLIHIALLALLPLIVVWPVPCFLP